MNDECVKVWKKMTVAYFSIHLKRAQKTRKP
jgi:hypothetical protein